MLPLNAASVSTFTLTLLKQEQKSHQFSAKPQVNILTTWLPVPRYSVTSTKRSYRLVLVLFFAAVIPAWQQESHFVLQEERRRPLLSLETADSQ